MKLYKLCICALTLADGFSNPIKDENAKVIVEKGTDFSSDLADAPEVIQMDNCIYFSASSYRYLPNCCVGRMGL